MCPFLLCSGSSLNSIESLTISTGISLWSFTSTTEFADRCRPTKGGFPGSFHLPLSFYHCAVALTGLADSRRYGHMVLETCMSSINLTLSLGFLSLLSDIRRVQFCCHFCPRRDSSFTLLCAVVPHRFLPVSLFSYSPLHLLLSYWLVSLWSRQSSSLLLSLPLSQLVPQLCLPPSLII